MSLHPAPAADDSAGTDVRHWLSAAIDGDREAMGKACQAWRENEQSRADWHAYHLIGDVLRSGELASPGLRDAAFLDGLRQRLAAEPVVLAPDARRAAFGWRVPAAIAAGFVVAAGVLVVSNLSAPGSDVPAQSLAAGPPTGAIGSSAGVPLQALAAPGGVVIRDPRLDEFLRAHQSAKGGFAAAVPGSSLRRVDVGIVPGGPR